MRLLLALSVLLTGCRVVEVQPPPPTPVYIPAATRPVVVRRPIMGAPTVTTLPLYPEESGEGECKDGSCRIR